MAITEATLTSGNDTSNISTYTTASQTPTTGRLVLATVVNSKGTTPDTPTLTGNGLTWVQVATVTFGTIATPVKRVTLFRAMGTASAGTVAIDFGGVNQTGCAWAFAEFAGTDTSGTNGSGAIVQSVTNNVDSAASLTVTLAAFGSVNNATFGGFGNSDSADMTIGTGFTAIGATGFATPNARVFQEWKTANDTSVDANAAAGTPNFGGIAIEIKAASSSTPIVDTDSFAFSESAVVYQAGLSVQIGFLSTPSTAIASTIWTDVTGDVMGGSTDRGRQRELDTFRAGTCQITLDNSNRRYDPNYTGAGSPYNGNILPMRRLRVQYGYGGVTFDRFSGFIDGWQQQYTGPHSATVSVTATDAFKVLAAKKLPESVWATEILTDGPVHWYRLGDASGATKAIDSIAGRDASEMYGAPAFGTAGLVTGSSDTALTSTASSGFLTPPTAATITGYPMTINAVIKGTGGDGVVASLWYDSTRAGSVAQFGLTSNQLYFQAFPGDVSQTAGPAGASLNDNVIHMITVVWDAAGSMQLYVDGAAVGAAHAAAGTVRDEVAIGIGGGWSVSGGTQSGLASTVDEVAFFNTAVSAARIAVWYSAMTAPWNGDSPGTRAGRALDTINWPAAERSLSAGASVLQTAPAMAGQSALDHLQKVEQSEFGRLFISASGTVVLEARSETVNQASQATFVDAHNAGLGVRAVDPDYTDQLIRNDVTVQRTGGVARTATDATSITAYLTHSYSVTGLYHNSDDTSIAAAQYIVSRYKDPLQRISSLVLEPLKAPTTLFPQALGRELTDKITVKVTPQNVGTAFTQDTIIEGIRDEFGPKMWRTTWALSPADTQPFWALGVAGFSELGVTTRLGF